MVGHVCRTNPIRRTAAKTQRPYAKAGRWERPSDPDEWKYVLECTEFGPSFPQGPSPFDKLYKDKEGWLSREFLGQSEEAFTVNVFAPSGQRENLPVLVGENSIYHAVYTG